MLGSGYARAPPSNCCRSEGLVKNSDCAGWARGKNSLWSIIYVCAFWRESVLWGQVMNLRLTWELPQCGDLDWGVTGIGSGGWSRSFRWGEEWVKNKKLSAPFPAASLQNSINIVWSPLLYTFNKTGFFFLYCILFCCVAYSFFRLWQIWC